MKNFVVLALACLLGLLCSSCGGGRPRADFVFLNGNEPETIDPAKLTGQLDMRIADSLFEGLLRWSAKGVPEPGMAESWTISDDLLTYTFHLRENLHWSNGEPITTADFIRSWRRALEPETACEYNYQLFYLKNAEEFVESRGLELKAKSGEPFTEEEKKRRSELGEEVSFSQVGVQAADERTLVVTLKSPTPFFLALCAFTTLRPVHLPTVEKFGDEWIKPENIVTSGAFLLESWRLNDRICLRRNPAYWDAANVKFETVDALATENPYTSFNFFLSGKADLILDKASAPPQLIGEFAKLKEFHKAPFLGSVYIRFNVQKPPFTDQRVRQAFALAIDRERIVKKITRLGEPAAYSIVPPGCAGYEPPPSTLGYDPVQARALLAEAGFANGANFPYIEYLLNNKDMDRAIAVEIQSMLKENLNVRVELRMQEWKVYLDSLTKIDFDFARSSWVGDYPDPNTFLDMFVTNGGNNKTHWGNPEYDRLIAAAAKEPDASRRWDIFRQAETLLISGETPITPLYHYVGVQFYRPDEIGGIEGNVLDQHPVQFMHSNKPRQN